MNALAQHGIALARHGHWQLIDALELIERCRERTMLVGIMHATGSPALLGYVSDRFDQECMECDGTGEAECCCCSNTRSCPDCSGTGIVVVNTEGKVSRGEVMTWLTLNGEPPSAAAPVHEHQHAPWMDLHTARDLVGHYSRLVDRLQGIGGAA